MRVYCLEALNLNQPIIGRNVCLSVFIYSPFLKLLILQCGLEWQSLSYYSTMWCLAFIFPPKKHLFISLFPHECLFTCFMIIRKSVKKISPAALLWMGFYSINGTDYLHSSPIITCRTDSDRIISVHFARRDCTLSMSLVVLFRSPLVFAAMVVNLWMTPCGAHASESAADRQCSGWARGWRTTTIQNTRALALSLP